MALSGPTGLWDGGFGGSAKLSHVVLVGSRDLDPCEAALVATGRVQLIPADHRNLGAELRKRLAGKPVYVHLDCDVLEPGLVPTDFQVSGGLSFARLSEAFEALADLPVVGPEIAEFQARWSVQGAEETEGPLGSTAELLKAVRPLLDAAVRRADPA